MPSVPPLYDQIRQGSARARARGRALAWLGRPSYAAAAGTGALFGVGGALVDAVGRRLPSLMPLPPLSFRQTVVEVLYRATFYAGVAICAAAVLRFVRWAYVRARFNARAT